MKIKFITLCLLCNLSFGVANTQAGQNLGDLMTKITNINKELDKKQQRQKNLDNVISDSNAAIDQSRKTLESMKKLKDADTLQLEQIAEILPNIESETTKIENHVKTTIGLIYQQIKYIQAESTTLMGASDWEANNRKQQYLIRILNLEASKYQQLQTKLDELNDLNVKLSNELIRLDKELGSTSQKAERLKQIQAASVDAKQQLQDQIAKDQQQLTDLKHKQAVLSMLMRDINLDQEAHKPKDTNVNTKLTNQTSGDLSSSAFFDRKLVKPLNAKILVRFGAMRHSVKNNGILYEATNIPVFAISDGTVAYVGVLPGLGNVIVVNHGGNYMSIYAGIIPKVSKGDTVSCGKKIANSGVIANQPMGGVYFELRHSGATVNPRDIADE